MRRVILLMIMLLISMSAFAKSYKSYSVSYPVHGYYSTYSSSSDSWEPQESGLLIPILISVLAVFTVEGFAIWHLNKKLLDEFGYDIFSPGKLLLFGVQTLSLIILALGGTFGRLTALDIAFGLGFVGIILGVQFWMDKSNTNLKYAIILLFVRLTASFCVVIIVVILIVMLYLWLMGTGGGGRREDEDDRRR